MDIAVIGMAIEAAATSGLAELRKALRHGLDLIAPFPPARSDDAAPFLADAAKLRGGANVGMRFAHGAFLGRIDQFDAAYFKTSPAEAALMDPAQRLFLHSAAACLADAGYPGESLRGSRTGVFVGYMPDFRPFNYRDLVMKNTDITIDQFTTPNLISIIPSRVSYFLDFSGPAICLDTSCSSALVAIHQAIQSLRARTCDQALVGSVKLNLAPFLDLPKPTIESPDHRSLVFDVGAAGIGIGEGVGSVLLKPLDMAVQAGDRVYCVITGSAINQDGRSRGIAHPNVDAQVKVMLEAWRDAGIEGRELGYIEAHGTGTRVGDPVELAAIAKALDASTGRRCQFCAVGSVKANYGHWYEAAGIVSFIKVALAVYHGELYPQINLQELTDEVRLEDTGLFIPLEVRPWLDTAARRIAGVNGFGVSGTNAHIVVSEWEGDADSIAASRGSSVFVASAATREGLARRVASYVGAIDAGYELHDICFTSASTDRCQAHRVALTAQSTADLRRVLARWTDRGCLATPDLDSVWAAQIRQYLDGEAVRFDDARWASARRVRLPPEHSSLDRHWITLPHEKADRCAEWLYATRWESERPVNREPVLAETVRGKTVLLLHADQPFAFRIASELRSHDCKVRMGNAETFELAAEEMGELSDVIHLATIGDHPADTVDELVAQERRGHFSLLSLVKALQRRGSRSPITIHLISSNVAEVTGREQQLSPTAAALLGLGRALRREYQSLRCRALDIDGGVSPVTLLAHLWDNVSSYQRCIREGIVYNQVFDTLRYAPPRSPAAGLRVRKDGCYAITGGTGGLGLAFAHLLARAGAKTIALLSRSGTVPAHQRAIYQGLMDTGAHCECIAVDAGDPAALRGAIADLRYRYGALHGIVHASGIPGSHITGQQSLSEYRRVSDAKILGSWTLAQCALEHRPDFLLFYSSVASLFPAIGQGDYCAGNAYMDALAVAMWRRGVPVRAIEWVAWRDIGMAFDLGSNVNTTFKAISTEDAHRALLEFMKLDCPVSLIGEPNPAAGSREILESYGFSVGRGVLAALAHEPNAESVRSDEYLTTPIPVGRESGKYGSLEASLAAIWGRVLGYWEVDVTADIYDLGGDSLAIAEIVRLLHQEHDLVIDIADVVAAGSIERLTNTLSAKGTRYAAPWARA